jgi:hypothetical protein
MRGAITPLPHTSLWRDAETQGKVKGKGKGKVKVVSVLFN